MPIYSIVDYDGNTVPTGYEEVNSYSTTEVKTGDTWIDGKPIYRKCYTGTATGATNTIDSNLNPNNITLVNCGGNVFQTSNTRHMGIGGYINANWYNAIYVAENGVQLMLSGELSGGNYNVWIEYTKTTDGGNS